MMDGIDLDDIRKYVTVIDYYISFSSLYYLQRILAYSNSFINNNNHNHLCLMDRMLTQSTKEQNKNYRTLIRETVDEQIVKSDKNSVR